MADLSEMMLSEEYVRLYTAIESSGAQKGIIHIEDATDRLFWNKVVSTVCPGRYDVKPFSQPGAEGKRKLEQQYQNLNKEYLVAVDSDYDYLCPERNKFATELNGNKYVLHTFVYSRENYIPAPETIDVLEDSIHFHEKTCSQIKEALISYSTLIYEALVLFSWLHNKNQQQFPEPIFNECFKLPVGEMLVNDNLDVNPAAFNHIRHSVQDYVSTHTQHISDEGDLRRHQEALLERGIKPENALLFINGHYLIGTVFKPAFELLIKKSRENDHIWVTQNYPDTEVKARKGQVRTYYAQHCNVGQLIHRCDSYTSSPFWQKITQKLTDIGTSD